MRIYIAGPYTSALMASCTKHGEPFRYKLAKKHMPKDLSILESYHYIGKGDRYSRLIKGDKQKIFLDSGAFSMFTQGIDVDLALYAEYIQENKKMIEVASNLDVIGRGNEKGTWKNQKKLEKMGAYVAPVHHARDKDKWLHKYLAEGYEYIFLGGMVPETTKYLMPWLDRVWGNILTNKDGSPKVKVHGFGLTTPELMLRYPWYSVDSTSWIMAAASGSMYYPVYRKGKVDGVKTKYPVLKALSISDAAPSAKKRGSHFNTVSIVEQEKLANIAKTLGFKLKLYQGRQYGRSTWNIMMFKWLEDNGVWPKTFFNHKGLFDDQGF